MPVVLVRFIELIVVETYLNHIPRFTIKPFTDRLYLYFQIKIT